MISCFVTFVIFEQRKCYSMAFSPPHFKGSRRMVSKFAGPLQHVNIIGGYTVKNGQHILMKTKILLFIGLGRSVTPFFFKMYGLA